MGVLYETVNAANRLFCFVNLLEKSFNVNAEQGDDLISSICFTGLENYLYLLITRTDKPNLLEGKLVKRRR